MTYESSTRELNESSRQDHQITMCGNSGEVVVGRKERKSVLTTGCGNQELNRPGDDSS
jgi:hypothetical protein